METTALSLEVLHHVLEVLPAQCRQDFLRTVHTEQFRNWSYNLTSRVHGGGIKHICKSLWGSGCSSRREVCKEN
jgi:hypothetical protein